MTRCVPILCLLLWSCSGPAPATSDAAAALPGPDAATPPPADAGEEDEDAGTAGPDAAAGPQVVDCPECTVFTGGQVFDGERLQAADLIIRGAAVQRVVPERTEVRAGTVVDVRGRTVTPGLIDVHVHLAGEPGPYDFDPGEVRTEHHLKAMLRSGVTSFLDVGSSMRNIFEWRARTRLGKVAGPTVFAAGAMITPHGGHPCTAGSPPNDSCIFVDGPADVAKVRDLLLPYGPDVLKVMIDSGTANRPLPRLSNASLQALQAVASGAGKRIIAHVGGAQDVSDALDAGILLFAHAPYYDLVSPALAARLAEEGAVVVPTLAVGDLLNRVAHQTFPLDDPELPEVLAADTLASFSDPAALTWMTDPAYQAWTQSLADNSQANLRTLLAAGVTIAAGTDAANPGTVHGWALHRELALYVEAGMPPLEALRAATANAADLVGDATRGRLTPGAAADLLVLDGDPAVDIAVTRRLVAVYKGGRAVDRAAMSVKSSASVVRVATRDLAEGAACLDARECAKPLACDTWNTRCAPACDAWSGAGCAAGSYCLAQAGAGACTASSHCDPLAQDCENGAACVFMGNAATACFYGAKATAGEPCELGMYCAPGAHCSFRTGTCSALCDPAAPDACGEGQVCKPLGTEDGVTVGSCD